MGIYACMKMPIVLFGRLLQQPLLALKLRSYLNCWISILFFFFQNVVVANRLSTDFLFNKRLLMECSSAILLKMKMSQ